jgi:HEAT repeat protein
MGEAGVRRGPRRWRLLGLIGSLVVAGALVGASRIPPLRRAYFLWQLERAYRAVPREKASVSPEFSRVMYYQQKLIKEGEPVVQPLLARRHKYDSLWYWTTTVAAGALGSPQAEPAFVEDTRSEDMAVVCQALTELGALPALHCQDRVLTLLASPAAEVRAKAIQLVVEYRIREAYPTLTAMLRSDPDPMVRELSVEGVGRLGRREAIPSLIQALDDPGVTRTSPIVTVRSAAQFWLSALTGKSFATKADWEHWWQEEQARPGAPQPTGAR